MTRWKASGIHLSISCLIGLTAFCLLYFVYYPQPYFKAAGADQLVLILLGVDVVLGPLLTLVAFRSGKNSLKFDLITIAATQIAALVYGLHVMWVSRPVFIVAAVDRIEIVYSNDLDENDLAKAPKRFSSRSLTGPEFVGVAIPESQSGRQELVDSAMVGKDIQLLPKYYIEWNDAAADALFKKAIPVEYLPSLARQAMDQIQRQHPQSKFAVLPLKGRTDSFSFVFDTVKRRYIEILDVPPW